MTYMGQIQKVFFLGVIHTSYVKPFKIPHLPILSYPILSYPILSYPILSYPILSYPILSYPILSYPILSYPILSYPILSYPILSYPILSYPILSYPIPTSPVAELPSVNQMSNKWSHNVRVIKMSFYDYGGISISFIYNGFVTYLWKVYFLAVKMR